MGFKNTSRISRRNLLKIGAVATGTLAANSEGTGRSSDATPQKPFDKEIESCCQLCQTRCTTFVQVKDGRVVNVYGNPGNYWTEGGLCPKGQAMVELTYSPHRLLHPLKREGNKWNPISYREAVDLIAEKILQLKSGSPEEYAHRVAMIAPLWESRESELVATMVMKLSGFPDIYHPGDT